MRNLFIILLLNLSLASQAQVKLLMDSTGSNAHLSAPSYSPIVKQIDGKIYYIGFQDTTLNFGELYPINRILFPTPLHIRVFDFEVKNGIVYMMGRLNQNFGDSNMKHHMVAVNLSTGKTTVDTPIWNFSDVSLTNPYFFASHLTKRDNGNVMIAGIATHDVNSEGGRLASMELTAMGPKKLIRDSVELTSVRLVNMNDSESIWTDYVRDTNQVSVRITKNKFGQATWRRILGDTLIALESYSNFNGKVVLLGRDYTNYLPIILIDRDSVRPILRPDQDQSALFGMVGRKNGVALSDGKIWTVGRTSDSLFRLCSVNPDGTIDFSFTFDSLRVNFGIPKLFECGDGSIFSIREIFTGRVPAPPHLSAFTRMARSPYAASLKADGDTSNIVAKWSPPKSGGMPITAYELSYQVKGSNNWIKEPVIPSTDTSHIISGITKGLIYELKLRAVNQVGSGTFSNIVTVATKTSTGVSEMLPETLLDIYPNPAKTCSSIFVSDPNIVFSVYDLLGNDVSNGNYGPCTPGIYILKLNINSSGSFRKLIVE